MILAWFGADVGYIMRVSNESYRLNGMKKCRALLNPEKGSRYVVMCFIELFAQQVNRCQIIKLNQCCKNLKASTEGLRKVSINIKETA